ncbi:MAG: cytochrome c biogenesis protein CcsA [Zoogloeaceae bacterium]|jgi:ABC-type uncharacterized transport system permease subunit|nr:cytochrome c biogenesis protein CcsA [Zoogloeaceae bacterium]
MAPIVNQLTVFGLTALLYLLLGGHFWRTRWSETGALPASASAPAWERAAIGATLFLHATGLKLALFQNGNMFFSFSLALSLMAWLAALIYWLESFRARMDGLQPIVLLVGAVATLLPLFFAHIRPIPHAHAWGFRLHFLCVMLAYSLFMLAAIHAVFIRIIDKRLHAHLPSRRMAHMPSLLALEAVLFRILAIAFAFLTLALVSGLLYSESQSGTPLPFNHKTVFAFLSWIIFGVLLAGRHIYGWRGRKALHWTLTGFASLLLAYVGSRFVLEVILQRI